MPSPVSALEHRSSDFVREVSVETINFYVDGLSGLYLPDDFREAHADVFEVRCWKPDDRLHGKFGRFALRHAGEDEQAELDDILVMGTTVGLHSLDYRGKMDSLWHYSLYDIVRDTIEEKDLMGAPINIVEADYGYTSIRLDESGTPQSVNVSGSSSDIGRANTVGRQQTCELFERLLGDTVSVINVNPTPRESEQIIK